MSGFKFTFRSIETLTCPAGRKDMLVFDPAMKGFGIRVSSGGGKVFLAQVTVGGIKRRVPIGAFGVLTIEQARTEAAKVLRAAAGGVDLVAEKRERARLAAAAKGAAAFTFERLVEGWAEARDGERRPSYLREARACLLRNLPDWLNRPASGITTAEAIDQLDRLKRDKSVVAANRTLAYARAAYGWAVKRQRLAANPLKGIEQPGREVSRERVLSAPELAAIWTACETLTATPAAFVRVLMLTLQRREEVAGMTWAELDDAQHPTTWILPRERAKNGKAHVVHLSDPARAIIASLPRMQGNPYVFAGRGEKPIGAFSRMKTEILAEIEKAGGKALPDWRLHDFRRSGVTHLANADVAPHVADRLLNHITGTIQGVAAVYQRAQFLGERKAALDAWADLITTATKGPAPAPSISHTGLTAP